MKRGPARRYTALDSLRGIAACAVALFHLHSTGTVTNLPFVTNGWIFVDFFFVLSGFVIAASYGARLRQGFPLGEFMLLRFGRIYPLHIAMLAVFLGFELIALQTGGGGTMTRVAFTGSREPSALIESVLLVQIFGLSGGVSWNVPSWSIAAEMWAYFLAASGARLLGRKFTWLLLATALLAPAVLALVAPHDLDRTFSWSLVRCLYGFSLGWLLFDHARPFPLPPGLATALEAAVVVALVTAVSWLPGGAGQLAYPPLFAAAVWVFSAEGGLISTVLRLPAFRRLGDWSYSIYMLHYFVLGRLIDLATIVGRLTGTPLTRLGGGQKLLAGPTIVPDLMALLGLACVILIARYSYTYLETPCRLASRSLAERLGHRSAREQERVAPTI